MLQLALTYPKIVTLLLSLSILITPAAKKLHPLHVSTTEANLNAKEKTLEITCTLFTDDFEIALNKKFKQKVDLNSTAMHNKMDELVKSYISSHLTWKVNGKPVTMNYIGFEIDKEAVNAYFEITQVSDFNKIETTDNLLFDLFDDQISILHVSKGGVRKSNKMVSPDQNFIVTF